MESFPYITPAAPTGTLAPFQPPTPKVDMTSGSPPVPDQTTSAADSDSAPVTKTPPGVIAAVVILSLIVVISILVFGCIYQRRSLRKMEEKNRKNDLERQANSSGSSNSGDSHNTRGRAAAAAAVAHRNNAEPQSPFDGEGMEEIDLGTLPVAHSNPTASAALHQSRRQKSSAGRDPRRHNSRRGAITTELPAASAAQQAEGGGDEPANNDTRFFFDPSGPARTLASSTMYHGNMSSKTKTRHASGSTEQGTASGPTPLENEHIGDRSAADYYQSPSSVFSGSSPTELPRKPVAQREPSPAQQAFQEEPVVGGSPDSFAAGDDAEWTSVIQPTASEISLSSSVYSTSMSTHVPSTVASTIWPGPANDAVNDFASTSYGQVKQGQPLVVNPGLKSKSGSMKAAVCEAGDVSPQVTVARQPSSASMLSNVTEEHSDRPGSAKRSRGHHPYSGSSSGRHHERTLDDLHSSSSKPGKKSSSRSRSNSDRSTSRSHSHRSHRSGSGRSASSSSRSHSTRSSSSKQDETTTAGKILNAFLTDSRSKPRLTSTELAKLHHDERRREKRRAE
ncbi:hypothetical protein N3K66_007128 [Trichothecium roseum]|uniref:Uncharacterized protein n=1 Tax=Trichothecium roseum TaxID=47278 RepID=A0ACC0UZ20_9HYPO|nr:hypothetical protein N3K66_007128 [Trichothecium roseum]